MKIKHNPYYNPEELGLTVFSLDESNLSCAYNTFCVWITPDKQIYVESDSGCSCPTPFEKYESATIDKFKQQTTRYPDIASVMNAVRAWNNEIYDAADRCPQSELNRFEARLKAAIV